MPTSKKPSKKPAKATKQPAKKPAKKAAKKTAKRARKNTALIALNAAVMSGMSGPTNNGDSAIVRHRASLISDEEAESRQEEIKTRFLVALEEKYGNVTTASTMVPVSERTLRRWMEKDEQFRTDWHTAVNLGMERLVLEATRRAVEGVEQPVYHMGEVVGFENVKSDKLLSHLLNQQGVRKKWRARLGRLANIAIEGVRDAGRAAGLTEEQIIAVQSGLLERFKDVPTD